MRPGRRSDRAPRASIATRALSQFPNHRQGSYDVRWIRRILSGSGASTVVYDDFKRGESGFANFYILYYVSNNAMIYVFKQ